MTRLAARYQRASSGCGQGGSSRTRPASPSRPASSTSPSGSARPAPLGPPTNAMVSRPARAGSSVDHGGGRVQHDVRRLERLDPAGEDQDDAVLRQAQLLAGQLLRARLEDLEVDAGVDHGHPGRVGVVAGDQLPGLVVGVRDQAVRGRDDLGLAAQPGGRLEGVAGRQGRVLHLRERVHGLDQRYAPPFLGHRADLPGEPVMPVNQVIAAGRVGGLGAQQLEGELAQLARKIGLVQVLERAGGEMADHTPGASCATGGCSRETARVKMSTSTPRSASSRATSTT